MIRLTRSLACEIKKHTSKSTTGSPKHSGIPCAMVYDLLRALSGDRALLSPSPVRCVASSPVNASVEASRPHGFAVRAGAVRLATPTRPSHPAPNVRDDRDTPLLIGAGRGGLLKVICPTAQAEFWACSLQASLLQDLLQNVAEYDGLTGLQISEPGSSGELLDRAIRFKVRQRLVDGID